MKLSIKRKNDMVLNFNVLLKKSLSTTLIGTVGVTSYQLVCLRIFAKEKNIEIKSIKNTLAKLALKNTNYENLFNYTLGSILFVFSNDEFNDSIKFLLEFSKKYVNINILAFSFNGKVFLGNDIVRITKLPCKNEALYNLVSSLNSVVSKLIYVLRFPVSNCLFLFDSLSNSKR